MSQPFSPTDQYSFISENPEEYPNNESDSSSESDSDQDDYAKEKKPQKVVQITVKEQLMRVLGEIKDGKSFKAISDDVKDRLAQKTNDAREPTTLHILAVIPKDDLPKEKDLKPLVEYLVKRPERLLTEKDDYAGLTPLHLAISQKNRTMIKWMCQAYDDIDKVLSLDSYKNGNCLHTAIEKGGRIVGYLVSIASAETLSAKDDKGNTALHLAVEWKRCFEKQQLDVVKAIVQKCDDRMRTARDGDFNNALRSPYLHHLDSCAAAEAAERRDRDRTDLDKKRRDEESRRKLKDEKDGSRTARTAGSKDARPAGPTITVQPPAAGYEDGASIQRLRRQGTLTAESPLLPGKKPMLPGKSPNAMRQESGQPRAPPSTTSEPTTGPTLPERVEENKLLRKKGPPGDAKTSSSASKESAVEDIRKFLKLHYLRSRSHDAAFEILYGRNPSADNIDKSIFFDLSGYPTMTKTGIQKTMSILKFDDILQYVDIPKISMTEESNLANTKRLRGRPTRPDGDGRNDLVDVFRWLKGVKTVLKVIVDDSERPAHSDVAIETALRDKGVETWDWKKIDLCSEVIHRVAPNVREINLYWSGNNAVLRAWSEKAGLPQLPQLERVTLHVQQHGLEPLSRLKDSEAEFRNRLTKQVRKRRFKQTAGEITRDMVRDMLKETRKHVTKVKVSDAAKDMAKSVAEEMEDMTDDLAKKMAKSMAEELKIGGTAREKASSAAKEELNDITEEAPKKMGKWLADEITEEIAQQLTAGVSDEKVLAKARETIKLKARRKTEEVGKEMIDAVAKQLKKVDIVAHYPERLHDSLSNSLSRASADNPDQPRKHEWIECMRAFKELLFTAESNAEPNGAQRIAESIKEKGEPIVVAIIDDGIDVKELELDNHGRITGRSFFPHHDSNRTVPYYESSGGHGTIMASQIHRICPKAELYVLKLEDYTDRESKERKITLKSAAEAIRHAVKKKVHIISMSWTITPPTGESSVGDIKALETAIIEAAQAGILMFCSASDEGAKQSSTFPSKSTSNIFRIGGADATGNLYKPVGDIDSVDFILPGKLVEGEGLSDAAVQKVNYWTGSSVATALAAGLAALILYCGQIRILQSASQLAESRAKRDFELLKTHEKMMEAFKNIGTTNSSNGKYLKVWDVFGKKVRDSENMSGIYSGGKLIDLVADVATTLCAKF